MAPPTRKAPPDNSPAGLRKDLDDEIQARKDSDDAHAKAEARLRKKAKAQSRLTRMILVVQEKADSLVNAAERIGNAYSDAASNHTTALQQQAQKKAIEAQELFSILTILSSGALSWAGGMGGMAGGIASDFAAEAQVAKQLQYIEDFRKQFPHLVDANMEKILQQAKETATTLKGTSPLRQVMTGTLKDTMSAGLGEVFSALGPLWHPPAPEQPVSIDPDKYRGELKAAIGHLKGHADQFLRKLAEKIDRVEDEEWDHYDDTEFQTEFEDWQTEANKLADEDHLPDDEGTMAKEMEKFIWAAWIPRLKHKDWQSVEFNDYEITVYERVYKPLDDRFVALGIETEAQTDLPRDEEDEILLAWAKNYPKIMQPWVKGERKAKS